MKKVFAACAFIVLFVTLGSCWLLTTDESPIYAYPELKSGYAVTVLESGARFGFFSVPPRYAVRITRKRGRTGHDFDVSLFNTGEDVHTYLGRGGVVENGEGITFSQPSGHSVFVPRQWYEGGR